jgi:large subunit ribosomal protein L6
LSRIGKLPIPVPSGVTVEIDGSRVKVTGPKGTLERTLPPPIKVRQEDGTVVCERPSDSRVDRSMHGLTRTLVANMVTGVSQGFTKNLELVGVGYRVSKQGDNIVLSLGYSHPVPVAARPGISFEVTDPTHFAVSGIDAELVGQVAADIRKQRKPEPYKGKGIMYRGERIRRKAGKAGKAK